MLETLAFLSILSIGLASLKFKSTKDVPIDKTIQEYRELQTTNKE